MHIYVPFVIPETPKEKFQISCALMGALFEHSWNWYLSVKTQVSSYASCFDFSWDFICKDGLLQNIGWVNLVKTIWRSCWANHIILCSLQRSVWPLWAHKQNVKKSRHPCRFSPHFELTSVRILTFSSWRNRSSDVGSFSDLEIINFAVWRRYLRVHHSFSG